MMMHDGDSKNAVKDLKDYKIWTRREKDDCIGAQRIKRE